MVTSAPHWSPHAVGAGIGLLVCLGLVLSDKAIGCSSAFSKSAGMLERWFRGKRAPVRPYYREVPPAIDWDWMLVAGLFLGALAAALLAGDFALTWVPASWAERFGHGVGTRLAVAVPGGVLLGFGARWAGGCTSGHGISGTAQLAASSWLALLAFAVGGVASALLLHGG
jgi:uncharacterized membrane protein YedE/YeeE